MEKDEYFRMYDQETRFWWFVTLHELVDGMVRKFKPAGKITILDAGCGTGRMMEILQKHGVTDGIDFSEDAVQLSKNRGLVNVIRGDLNNFPFRKDQYDIIISLDVLYHTGIRDDSAVLRFLYDALKPEGIMIINLPAFECLKRPHDLVVHTRERYKRTDFNNKLRENGYTVLKSTYRLPLLFFIIFISKFSGGMKKPVKFKSDLKEYPGWLNALFLFLGRIENFMLKKGLILPLGSSLFVVAKKPAGKGKLHVISKNNPN